MSSGIKVFAPATVSNVACGFDVLGYALHKPGDEITVRFKDTKGLVIKEIRGAKGKLPYDIHKNTASVAALSLLKHLGEEERGIEMTIHKKMPFGSGLGSSAASAVAGAFAVHKLLKSPLSKRDLLPFILDGEVLASGSRHSDNVAPSLLGGMILCRTATEVYRLPTPKGLYTTVVYPHIEVLTKEARAILKPEVPLKNAIAQSANIAGLITGFYNSDFDLIKSCLEDHLIEHQRAPLIKGFYKVKEAALKEGVLGCSISGAGPSIFAISANSLIAENAGVAMQRVFNDLKIENDLFISEINSEGAILL